MISVSKKLSATALTRTTASPGAARGGSMSVSLRAVGGPKCVQRTAFIRLIHGAKAVAIGPDASEPNFIITKIANWESGAHSWPVGPQRLSCFGASGIG